MARVRVRGSHSLTLQSEPPEKRVLLWMCRQRTTPSCPMSMYDFCIVLRFHTRILQSWRGEMWGDVWGDVGRCGEM